MNDTDNMLDFDSYINIDIDNTGNNRLDTTEKEEGVYENVQTDELIEQLAIVEENQQVIINNLSYQSNIITFGFIVFLGVLVMKCLLHFFN